MKKISAIFIMLIIILTQLLSVSFAASFSDLSKEHWAFKYIDKLADSKVINGYPDGTFKPENTITRGEFFKLIMTAFKGSKAFEGATYSVHWAEPYVLAAAEEGVMMNATPVDELDVPITRLEMGVVIGKICNRIIDDEAEESDVELNFIEFNDLKELSLGNRTYIEYIAALGIVNGYPDGSFGPNNNMTRAEVATVIYRFNNLK